MLDAWSKRFGSLKPIVYADIAERNWTRRRPTYRGLRTIQEIMRKTLEQKFEPHAYAFVAATSQTMREGSKMPRADWKQMQTYPAPLPPAGLLRSFEATITTIVEQLKTLTFANQKLRAARDLLLPRLMSGEIAV